MVLVYYKWYYKYFGRIFISCESIIIQYNKRKLSDYNLLIKDNFSVQFLIKDIFQTTIGEIPGFEKLDLCDNLSLSCLQSY